MDNVIPFRRKPKSTRPPAHPMGHCACPRHIHELSKKQLKRVRKGLEP